MTSVVWAVAAADHPMGQQIHEQELQQNIRDLAPRGWQFELVTVGGWRDRGRGTVGVPQRALSRLPYLAARAVGSLVYPLADLVHRFDLRLPPAQNLEILTIHDLPPARFSDEGRLPQHAKSSVRRARLVLCPSNFAVREVESILGPATTQVIPNGVGQAFDDGVALASALAIDIPRPYVLTAGGSTARKNLAALASAWREVIVEEPLYTLVLAGPRSPARDAAFAACRSVLQTGHLLPNEVATLMRGASAVVVPSIYEGFGLPALEALAVGTPVVATNCGALPEVLGDCAAVLVEPTASALATGILKVVRLAPDEVDRIAKTGKARARTFTWRQAAEATLISYEEVLRFAS